MPNVTHHLHMAQQLGKIVENLLSIELGARMAIDKFDTHRQREPKTPLTRITAGQWVDVDIYSNDWDLNQTLERYNRFTQPEHKVDVRPIVALRDAIAHGRKFGIIGGSDYMRLVKFGRVQRNNQVETLIAVDMTPEWFAEQLTMTVGALMRINNALGREMRNLGDTTGEQTA